MRGLYIFSTNDRDYKANGEAKKVLSQVDAFKKAGVDIELLDVIKDKKIDKIIYRLPFCGVYNKDLIKKCEQEVTSACFVYIRKNIFDSTYYSLLKKIKKSNPEITIFVEIPTYPYFQEWSRIIDKPLIIKEKTIIPKVTKEHLVDYYLTLTDDQELFGIPTIKFDNCIAVENVLPKKCLQNIEEIHLIGVALVANWHGYDRVIRGMKEYYNNNNNITEVYFHIVGDGPALSDLQHMVIKLGLTKYVIFEGKQKGESLDQLYNISNIGIGSLGTYRKGITKARSLKLREYCARGIPFIKGDSDELFDDYTYCLNFSNDNQPIDISRIITWAQKIDYEQAIKDMRIYAAQNFNWGKYIRILLDAVKEKAE